jgi:hypothetical protein
MAKESLPGGLGNWATPAVGQKPSPGPMLLANSAVLRFPRGEGDARGHAKAEPGIPEEARAGFLRPVAASWSQRFPIVPRAGAVCWQGRFPRV